MSRKDEILKQAVILFDTKGYHETTVEDIGQAVGMKKGSLYYHINSKEQLLYEIHDQFLSQLLARVEAQLKKDDDDDYLQKIKTLIYEHAMIMDQFAPQIRVFFREFHALSAEYTEKIVVIRRQYEKIMLEVLQGGIEANIFKQSDAKVVSFIILGMLNFMFQWYTPGGRLSIEEIADIFTSTVLFGLVCKNEELT